MADIELKSFPFDSMKVLNEESGQMEDDRLYEAQIFRDYFRKFLSNGVYFGTYKNYGENSMKVSLDTGLTIKVTKGCGIIEGVDYENESDRLITLDRPASGNRVDRVVVQMNSSLDTRMTKLIIKQGTGTTSAELTRTDNVYEICLAEVMVKSTSNIADGDIVDTRLDTTLCGIVNSLISVDGEELYQRFQEYVQSVEENMMLKNEDIVDNLISTDTDKALSAYQGKVLKRLADNLAENKANSNDVYTKTEEDNKLTNYKLKGDFAIISGNINKSGALHLSYPTGFNKNNSVVISAAVFYVNSWSYFAEEIVGDSSVHTDLVAQPIFGFIDLEDSYINCKLNNMFSSNTYPCKIVLMKI